MEQTMTIKGRKRVSREEIIKVQEKANRKAMTVRRVRAGALIAANVLVSLFVLLPLLYAVSVAFQPDAIIYLQAIIKVTTERSEQGDYINNEGIIARNEGIARLADNEHVFFLDVNPLICDETGGMIPEYTFDGVHLKAVYIDIWKDFLKTHAVSLP